VDPERLPEVDAAAGASLWTRPGLRLLAVGRLSYYKGFETLIRAAALEDRGYELIVVGEGEERPKLERILAEAGNPAWVRLLGQADDATLHRLMASCDVYCLPSRERTEAFGIVLMEAMRYGKPLLVSDLRGSGVTWVARDGHNAVIVPPGNVLAWRAAIETLAAHPPRRPVLENEVLVPHPGPPPRRGRAAPHGLAPRSLRPSGRRPPAPPLSPRPSGQPNHRPPRHPDQ